MSSNPCDGISIIELEKILDIIKVLFDESAGKSFSEKGVLDRPEETFDAEGEQDKTDEISGVEMDKIVDIIRELFKEEEPEKTDEISDVELEKVINVIQELFKEKEPEKLDSISEIELSKLIDIIKELFTEKEPIEDITPVKKEPVEDITPVKKEPGMFEKTTSYVKNLFSDNPYYPEQTRYEAEDEYDCNKLLSPSENGQYEPIAVYLDENTTPNTYTCVYKNVKAEDVNNTMKKIGILDHLDDLNLSTK
jgi:hypothetical protein